jgi:hypothetical protein
LRLERRVRLNRPNLVTSGSASCTHFAKQADTAPQIAPGVMIPQNAVFRFRGAVRRKSVVRHGRKLNDARSPRARPW